LKKSFKIAILSILTIFITMPNVTMAVTSDAPTWDDDVYEKENECGKNVKLSKEQQKKLDDLYDKLYEDKKEIVETLEEYGVITKKQKDKHLKWLKTHNDKAKKHHYYWCDDDDWEDDDLYEDEDWD